MSGEPTIWVRKTLDWEDEAAFQAQLSDFLRPRVALWDSTFTMPYHLFRAAVRDIALRNLRTTGLQITTDWAELPDDGYVLPVDDDDWFDPAIAERLLPELDGIDFVFWRSDWVETATLRHRIRVLRQRYLPKLRPVTWLSTNNYVLRKETELRRAAEDHIHASELFEEAPGRFRRIDARLSIANRNLGSHTSLTWTGERPLTRDDLVRMLRRHRRLYGRSRRLVRPSWSRPYLESMDELMSRIDIR